MHLNYKKKFKKNFSKLPQKLKDKASDTLELFHKSSNHKSLRRHKLKGKLKNFESLDVSGDIRILIYPQTLEIIDVIDIGNHNYFYH